MTFNEAVAMHAPAWVAIWINILLLGAIALPLTLAFWKETRPAALLSIFASAISIGGIMLLYQQLGYVKLLGLAHIVAWTPFAIYLWFKMCAPDVTRAPRVIMGVVFATIIVSLVFDYVDAIRYLAGDRIPLAVAASCSHRPSRNSNIGAPGLRLHSSNWTSDGQPYSILRRRFQ